MLSTIILIITFNILVCQELESDHILFNFTKINFREEIQYRQDIVNKVQAYKLVFSEQDYQKNIIVMFDDMSYLQQTKVYIFQNKNLTIDLSNPDIICDDQKKDYCVIQLKYNQKDVEQYIFFIIECYEKCIYRFKIDMEESSYNLKMIDFSKLAIEREMNFTIQIDEFQQSETGLEIRIANENIRYFNVNQIKIMKNEQDFTNAYQIDGIKQIGRLIMINKQYLQQGDIIKVQIKTQLHTLIKIETLINYEVTEIQLNKQYYGVQKALSHKNYKLRLPKIIENQNSTTLIFVIKLLVGQAKAFVNNEYSPLLSNFKYQMQINGEKFIQIPFSSTIFESFDNFYLVIRAEQFCQYEFYTYFENRLNMQIQMNKLIQGYILEDEIINLKFRAQSFIKEIVIDVVTNANVIIAKCHQRDCLINQKIIQEDSIINNEYEIIHSNSGQDQYTIQIQNSINESQQSDSLYIIALNSTQQIGQEKFSVIVNPSISSIELIENVPFKSIGCEFCDHQYFFIVEPLESAKYLDFLLTPLQGNFLLASVSQNQRSRQQNEYISINSYIEYSLDYKCKDNTTFYNINIYPNQFGAYTILAVLNREQEIYFGNFDWNYILLSQGIPQDYILHKSDLKLRIILFKVNLKRDTNGHNQDVTIKIKPQINQIKIYGFNFPSRNPEKSIWQSQHQLKINANDQNYPNILYIRVELMLDHKLQVLYQLANQTTLLQVNQNYAGVIEQNESQIFFLDLYSQELLRFHKFTNFPQYSMFLNLTLKFGQIEQSYLFSEIDQEFNKTTCPGTNSSQYHCKVTIILTCSITTQFSLLIQQKNYSSSVELFQNEQMFKSLIIATKHYYFIKTKKDDITINVRTFGNFFQYMSLKIYFQKDLKIVYESTELEENLQVFKEIQAEFQKSMQAVISKEEFKDNFDCLDVCTLYIELELPYESNIVVSNQVDYMIQFTKNITHLLKGDLFDGKGANFSIQYFQFDVMHHQTNIMIILSPLSDCEVDLYVSKNTFPSSSNYDWKSEEYLEDQIQIQAGNPIHPESNGTYYVAVYHQQVEICQYQIGYSTGDTQLYNIKLGYPINLYLKQNEIVYFQYFHTLPTYNPIKFILNQNKGQAVIYIDLNENRTFTYSQIYEKKLNDYLYNNLGDGYSKSFETDISSTFICIIALLAQTDCDITLGLQAIDHEIHLQKNQNIINEISAGNSHKYVLSSNQKIQIDFQIYHGSIELCSLKGNLLLDQLQLSKAILYSPKHYTFDLEYQNDGLYKIVIFSLGSSIYTIEYNDRLKKQLNLNQRYVLNFHQNQARQFTFQNLGQELEQITLTIEVEVEDHYIKQFRSEKRQYPQVVMQRENGSIINPINEFIFQDIYHIEYKNMQGKFITKIINKSNFPVKIITIIGNQAIKQLNSLSSLIVTQNVKNPTYWEYYCIDQGYLLVQINTCRRIMYLKSKDNLNKLKKGVYDQSFIIRQNNNIFTIPILKKGPYYLQTKIYESESIKYEYLPIQIYASFTSFNIQLNLNELKQHDFKYDYLYENNQHTLLFQMQPLDLENITKNNFIIDKIKYSLSYELFYYEMKNFSFNFCMSQDQISVVSTNNFQFLNDSINLSISLNQEQGKSLKYIAVQIQAEVTIILQSNEKIQFFYNYPEELIKFNPKITYQEDSNFIFITLVLLIFILLSIFFYVKFKKFKIALKLEISNNQNFELSQKII